MNHKHSQDIFAQADGTKEYRDPWIVTTNEMLDGEHFGGVCVHEGASFEISRRGQLFGSLQLQAGSVARIVGQHSGSLNVQTDAIADVSGSQMGSVHVDRGGLVRVQPEGKLTGSLHIAGVVENRGVRGGSVQVSGGEIRDLDGGSVKKPARVEGNSSYYHE